MLRLVIKQLKMKKATKNTVLKQNGIEYKAVEHMGVIYWYREALGLHRKTVCLATTDPTSYCNGVYLYSDKNPGSGKVFEVVAQTFQDEVHPHIPLVNVGAQYNDSDLLKAFELAQQTIKEKIIIDEEDYVKTKNPQEDVDYIYIIKPKYKASTILEMLKEIQVINVDENFKILNYE